MGDAYKSLGIISICLTWIALGFLVYKWRGDKSMSFSKHASSHKKAYITMGLVESLVLPAYFIFVYKWFVPTLHLPPIFTVLNAIGAIGLLIAAWVPDVADLRGKVHEGVAYPAYFCIMLSTIFLVSSTQVSNFSRIISIMAFTYMLIAGCFLVLVSKAKSNYIYIQALFLASFHLSILTATYIRL